jgi:hypothetical protein
MANILFGLIVIIGISSYVIALRQIFKGRYAPNAFSRVVWFMLAIISFGSVVASDGTLASIVLAAVFLLGNAAMCAASLWRGSRAIGVLELICCFLLAASVLVWIIFNAPLISLCTTLFAHFVGAIPTYKRVLKDPRSEDIGFWSLFFTASAISLIASWGMPLASVVFPIYLTLFEGSMVFLSLRRTYASQTFKYRKFEATE